LSPQCAVASAVTAGHLDDERAQLVESQRLAAAGPGVVNRTVGDLVQLVAI
jgi:hypothetical protein